jgi:hypothetical protein
MTRTGNVSRWSAMRRNLISARHEKPHRLIGAARLQHLKARISENIDGHQTHEWLVFDNEDETARLWLFCFHCRETQRR